MFYLPDEDGQGLAEYALILVLIAMVVVALVTIFGGQVASLFSTVTSAFP